MLRISQFTVSRCATCDRNEQSHHEPGADDHLRGTRAPNQLQHLVDHDRHDRDVEDIPPADRRTREQIVDPAHVARCSLPASSIPASRRSMSAARTTSTISATACTRTTWAPASTAAVTAAAVAQSRAAGARSPVARCRNDLREGPTRSGTAERVQLVQPREDRPRCARRVSRSQSPDRGARGLSGRRLRRRGGRGRRAPPTPHASRRRSARRGTSPASARECA